MISKNISNTYDRPDLVIYKSVCQCMDNTCNNTLHLEFDETYKGLILNMYQPLNPVDYYFNENIFKNFWRRLKYSVKILFGYPVDFEGFHLFNGEAHVRDYIKALNEGLEKMKESSL